VLRHCKGSDSKQQAVRPFFQLKSKKMRFTCLSRQGCFDLMFVDDAQDCTLVGVCTKGSFSGCMLVKCKTDNILCCTTKLQCDIALFENNMFGVSGSINLSLEESHASVAFARTLDSNSVLHPVCAKLLQSGAKIAQKSLPVVQCQGRTLSASDAHKAFEKWLQKNDSKIAPIYGLSQVVWCEHAARGCKFYYVDLRDRRKKICADALDAMQKMQHLTQSSFVNDMQSQSNMYVS
jgi:hypothetical protein